MVNATGITAVSELLVDILGKLLIMRGDLIGRLGLAGGELEGLLRLDHR
jgi:hypothetical protein